MAIENYKKQSDDPNAWDYDDWSTIKVSSRFHVPGVTNPEWSYVQSHNSIPSAVRTLEGRNSYTDRYPFNLAHELFLPEQYLKLVYDYCDYGIEVPATKIMEAVARDASITDRKYPHGKPIDEYGMRELKDFMGGRTPEHCIFLVKMIYGRMLPEYREGTKTVSWNELIPEISQVVAEEIVEQIEIEIARKNQRA